MKVKSESEVAQSCATVRDPMDCSLPGSSVHGIFQARATREAPKCILTASSEHISLETICKLYNTQDWVSFILVYQLLKDFPHCVMKMCVCVGCHFSRVRLCTILWTAAHQTPLAMGFSRQEYWSGLPLNKVVI